jgi:hypothetical protein
MTTQCDRPRFVLTYPRETPAMGLAGCSRIETEALARFAAEFLYGVSWNKATPEGMEQAYLNTIPVECGDEELHACMQELGQRVYNALGEDFRTWAARALSVNHGTPSGRGPDK